jgi:predicted transcriptional regulator
MQKKIVNFNLRIEDEIRNKFIKLAKEEDMTASQLVRKWIKEYVKNREIKENENNSNN